MKQVTPLIRKTFYYETDQMGIIHHANYVRWFEEARMDFLDKAGFSYALMEEAGVYIPVLSVNCEYKQYIKFYDPIEIHLTILEITGVRLKIGYEIRNPQTNIINATGVTTHCFLDKNYQVINVKKKNPMIFDLFKAYEQSNHTS